MPSLTLRLTLLLTPSVLLFASAGLLLILERTTQSLFRSNISRNPRTGTPEFPSRTSNSTLPIHEDHAPALAVLGVGVLALLVACVSPVGMWELRRVDGVRGAGQRAWCWGVMGMNGVVLGVGVGVLGWASGLQGKQEDADLGSGAGFTRETWVCGIARGDPVLGWAGSACGTAKATRFLLIPVAISALLAMLVVYVAVKQRGGASWLFGGKGRYKGFESVYELGSQGPAPQYLNAPSQFYPQPQGYPQPVYPAPQAYQQPVYAGQPQLYSGSYQPAPQNQKGAPAAGEPAVFR